MFEHFGILDIFSGFRKRKWIFSSIILGSSTLLIARFTLKMNDTSNVSTEKIYISSADYYVEPDEYVIVGNNNNYDLVSNSYVALLKSDLCKKYIFDNIMSRFSEEQILDQTELKMKKNHFNENSMSELYYVKRQPSSNIIEISSMTYDKNLSEYIRDVCSSFISNVVGKRISNSSIKLSGKIDRNIKKTDLIYENIDKDDKRMIVKPVLQNTPSLINRIIRGIIAPIVFIIAFCTLAIIVLEMFNPTMNRASDFASYGIPIIEDIKGLSKSKGDN